MIPLSLTLSGIYSYQQPQTIDFTRLTEASIFGIFGAVGSGKSTILEAISYALYGETERLNNRENRGYNMMNLKSNELLIDFVFRTGEDNHIYRFKVNGKRNRNSFEKINTFERTAYRKHEEEWIPIEADAEKILGLSYQNFRRTIIIPQGKFQDFLQLTDAERTRMMKELFNLDKFELYHKITSLEKKNSDERMLLEDRLQQMGAMDATQLDALREKGSVLKEAIVGGAQIIQQKGQIEGAYSQLKELFVRVQAQEQVLGRLQAREEEFRVLEERITQDEYCRRHFGHLFEREQTTQTEIGALSETLEKKRRQLHDVSIALEKEETQFQRVAAQFNQREELKRRAEELEKLAQVMQLKDEEAKISERISNGEMHYSRTTYTLGQLVHQQETLGQALKSLRLAQPDMATLAALSNWFTTYRDLQAACEETLQEENRVKTRIGQLREQKDALLTAEILAAVPRANQTTATPELLTLFEEAAQSLKKRLEALEEELQHLLLQGKLEAYATALQPGEPCPLCGATEHPHKWNATEIGQVLAEKQRQKQQLQQTLLRVEQGEKQLNVLATQFGTQKELLMHAQQKRQGQESRMLAHRKAFVWDSYQPEDEEKVKRAFVEAEGLKKQIEEHEQKADDVKKKLSEAEANKEKFSKAIAELRAQKEAKAAQIQTLLDQVALLNLSEHVHRTPEQLRSDARQLQNQYLQLGEAYQAREKALSALKIEAGTLEGNLLSLEERLTHYRQTADELARQLREQVAQSPFDSLEVVRALLQSPLNLEGEKVRLTDFRQQLHTAHAQYNSLLEQAEGKRYDEAAHAELLTEMQQLVERQHERQREATILEHQIAKLEKDLLLRKDLQHKLDGLQERAEDIGTLKKLFTASGFVNYVSSVYLQNLCNAANERFYKLTRQKLRLEITDKNDFQVRDFLHNGQVRSVKTLSGGQTFQAALCLALALADNIGQLTRSPQNFFFLDEGFGSLDKDSLQIVFDTLKSLRKENRIVGVISHVEEMHQEIDTYLRITNDEVTGSAVKTSWA